MQKRYHLVTAVAATAAVLASTAPSSATTGHSDIRPVVGHVRTEASFDYSTGEVPENITVNPDASVTLSLIADHASERPELMRISASGHRTVLATGQAGDGITGNVRGGDGTIYYNVWSSNADRAGVWKLPPGSKGLPGINTLV